MAEPIAFSVWLRPSGPLDDRLATAIREVSEHFAGSGAFPPHVTLLGNAPKVSAEEAKERTRKLAEKLKVFELKVLPELVFHDTWNQNVLMYVEESESLLEANRQAKQILLDLDETVAASFAPPSRRPHMSLIYGNHPADERSKIVSWMQDQKLYNWLILSFFGDDPNFVYRNMGHLFWDTIFTSYTGTIW